MSQARLPADVHAPFLEPGEVLSTERLREQEKRFLEMLDELMEKAREHRVTIRVIGSLAFRLRCPDHKHMEYDNGRYLTDIDFIAPGKDIAGIQDMFQELGWDENMTVLRLFGDKRRIFYHPKLPVHSDIFIDKLRFCHEIDFRGRLGIDPVTISLIDLLLEKLQIVEINRKDLIDMMVLLRQHETAGARNTNDAINGDRLAEICRKDWGWWRTATINLKKTREFAWEYLPGEEASIVQERVGGLERIIAEAGKTLRWKLRSLIGERLRWYREVEEVERD